jgi:hypothetical protein
MAATSEPASASVRAKRDELLARRELGNQRPAARRAGEADREAPSSWTARMSPVVAHDAAELLDRQAQGQQVRTEPAVRSSNGMPRMSWSARSCAEVLGEVAVAVDLGGPWRDLLVGQPRDRVAQEDLLLREADRPVDRRLGGHCRPS